MRRRLPDLLIIALLFALPLIVFWQQTVGGRTLLPTENLYQYEPFATYREVVHAPAVPHNALLSDLVLENYQWKSFIRQSIAQRELPLWNPHQFAGIPFFAAGQQSTLYPLSILYYVLPLTAAYGWFTVINLWLAGVFMYAFLRGLGVGRLGALAAGVIYQLSAFMLTSAVFPMILGAAVWLPLLLLMTEYILQQKPLLGRPASVPWVAIGAVALGCNILAGHVELTCYTLIIVAYYAAARLLTSPLPNKLGLPLSKHGEQTPPPDLLPKHGEGEKPSRVRHVAQRAGWLAAMVVLGFGLAAIQFIPLLELVQTNWRSDSASFSQVLDWAHPKRDILQFVMPNFYGNPSHHSYFDVFSGQTVTQFTNAKGDSITTIDWGIKNYVEGALYLGILPLALSLYALVHTWVSRKSGARAERYQVIIFALLTLIALTFMFGLPTYAILYYGFPGLKQSHTPFRWIYAVTLGVAALAGYGIDILMTSPPAPLQAWRGERLARRFSYILLITGIGILAALFLSRIFYPQIEPLITRIFNSMAQADQAFSDARMFYSYEFTNVLTFGLFALGAGAVFWLASLPHPKPLPTSGEGLKSWNFSPFHVWRGIGGEVWQILAIFLIALDLMIASWGFNSASDPALLDFTPPAIQWLQRQPGKWRYMTLDDPTKPPLMQANLGMRYGLDDVRGYESIIPKQYVDFMGQLEPPVQLDFNRIAPLYTSYPAGINFNYVDALKSPLLGLLNVRYLITHKTTTLPTELTVSSDPRRIAPAWALVYEDEAVRIWEHGYVPRAVVDQRLDGGEPNIQNGIFPGFDVAIDRDTGREMVLHANISPHIVSWLVVSETYMPGWRAFVRPRGGDDKTERPLEVKRVMDNFIGMNVTQDVVQNIFRDIQDALPEAQRMALDAGQITVRLVYSPTSFNIGLFGSVISMALIVLLVGVWLWRLFMVTDRAQETGISRVARNSLAPIILNLFNRGIDFAFAFVMLRVLGPDNAGIYYYAAFIFGWFDIFTNFGLNTFLTREVARDRSQAGRYLWNTSLLRLLLMIIGIALLLGFLFARQSAVSPPLTQEAVIAIGLLYVGLLPNSLSTGLSAFFYAFEQAEYPAVIATVATICRAVFGVSALLLGYGVIGLAGVSIITNCITLAIMLVIARRILPGGVRIAKPDMTLFRSMLGEGFPLMLNHFLASIFFQIDVVILQAVRGDAEVGQYSVAYKWVAALNIIPAFFTMALLPVMSRQAHEDRAALKRNYHLAIKLLVCLALPTAVLFTFLAYFLTGILGGSQYLPDGAIATQLMIWSIPIGWMNSLTQYLLIALDLQRKITWAFIIAVTFNIVINLLLIPAYGYRAAAITTIASEAVLLIPFGVLMQSGMGRIQWIGMVWKPLAATAIMLTVLWVGWSVQPVAALALACVTYTVGLLVLRPLSAEEQALLLPLIPGRLRRRPAVGRSV